MNKKGFTMAEVLVTISILAIMAAISIPTFISWLPTHRLQTSARQIYDDLNLAKMEAVRRNTDVCITFNNVNNNYKVFVDTNGDGLQNDGASTILKNNVTLENGVTISNSITIGFNNRGMTATAPGNINVTNPTGIIMRISVITSGNVSISTL
jgi:prepilin-type N-terminal cleavage/methylation domain-containing protein